MLWLIRSCCNSTQLYIDIFGIYVISDFIHFLFIFFRMRSVWPRASCQSPLAILRPYRCGILRRELSTSTCNRPRMATRAVMQQNVPHLDERQDQLLGFGATFAAGGSTWNAWDSLLRPRGTLCAIFVMQCIFHKFRGTGSDLGLTGTCPRRDVVVILEPSSVHGGPSSFVPGPSSSTSLPSVHVGPSGFVPGPCPRRFYLLLTMWVHLVSYRDPRPRCLYCLSTWVHPVLYRDPRLRRLHLLSTWVCLVLCRDPLPRRLYLLSTWVRPVSCRDPCPRRLCLLGTWVHPV